MQRILNGKLTNQAISGRSLVKMGYTSSNMGIMEKKLAKCNKEFVLDLPFRKRKSKSQNLVNSTSPRNFPHLIPSAVYLVRLGLLRRTPL